MPRVTHPKVAGEERRGRGPAERKPREVVVTTRAERRALERERRAETVDCGCLSLANDWLLVLSLGDEEKRRGNCRHWH